MNPFRYRFGIMQCLLALLLLLDAPYPGLEARGPVQVSTSIGSAAVVLTAQPPETVYKHETARSIGVIKRGEDPSPKAVGISPSSGVTPPPFSFARALAPPALNVRRHRVLASPPTGPPFA
jgi:hypothetical protein